MRRSGLRRRDLLAGGAGAAALGALGVKARAAPPPAPPPPGPQPVAVPPPSAVAAALQPVAVDVHCHTFCSADLPIVGFVAHFIPGLSDLSRLVSRWPEIAVRAFVGAVATLPNAVAPTGDAELAMLGAALAHPGSTIAPVPELPPAVLDLLLGELVKHLPFSVGVDKRRIIARYLEALYIVAHARGSIAASIAHIFPRSRSSRRRWSTTTPGPTTTPPRRSAAGAAAVDDRPPRDAGPNRAPRRALSSVRGVRPAA